MDDIQKMQNILNMMDTDGWHLIADYIHEEKKRQKDALLFCDINSVTIHRAKFDALDSVMIYIKEIIDKGQEELEKER